MNETTIAREKAVEELNEWYDELEVPEDLRIDSKEDEKDDVMREKVIRAIMSGNLVLNDKMELEYTLKEPITKKESEEIVLSKLIFKNRYRAIELESQMRGVKSDDFMAMTRAFIATLTGKPKALLTSLYNKDFNVAQAIYTLFTRGET